MTTGGATIGHPGKKGTLQDLLRRAFRSVPKEMKKAMVSSITDEIFNPNSLGGSLSRNYKTADVAYIHTLYGFLSSENDSEQLEGQP
jgi:hypothetical protein